MLRRSLAIMTMTTAFVGAGVGEAASTNPAVLNLPITQELVPSVSEFGTLDVGSLALKQAIAVEPPAVKNENNAVDAIVADTPDFVWNASGFNIASGGMMYAVTVGHVTNNNGMPHGPSCNNTQVIAHGGGGVTAGVTENISGRAGTYSGIGDIPSYALPDLGVYRLQNGQDDDPSLLMTLRVQEKAEPLSPGELLYNVNYQPTEGGAERSPLDQDEPDQLVGVTLGSYYAQGDEYVYAVLGLKSYDNDQSFTIRGSSGSPWRTASGLVVGVTSGRTTMSIGDIKKTYNIQIRGESTSMLPISLVQVIGKNMVKPLIRNISTTNSCPGVPMTSP